MCVCVLNSMILFSSTDQVYVYQRVIAYWLVNTKLSTIDRHTWNNTGDLHALPKFVLSFYFFLFVLYVQQCVNAVKCYTVTFRKATQSFTSLRITFERHSQPFACIIYVQSPFTWVSNLNLSDERQTIISLGKIISVSSDCCPIVDCFEKCTNVRKMPW